MKINEHAIFHTDEILRYAKYLKRNHLLYSFDDDPRDNVIWSRDISEEEYNDIVFSHNIMVNVFDIWSLYKKDGAFAAELDSIYMFD